MAKGRQIFENIVSSRDALVLPACLLACLPSLPSLPAWLPAYTAWLPACLQVLGRLFTVPGSVDQLVLTCDGRRVTREYFRINF
jgi:hypothetical protein